MFEIDVGGDSGSKLSLPQVGLRFNCRMLKEGQGRHFYISLVREE